MKKKKRRTEMLSVGALIIAITCAVLGREDLAKLWSGVAFAMIISYLEALWKSHGGTWSSIIEYFDEPMTYMPHKPSEPYDTKKMWRIDQKTKKSTSALYQSAVVTDKEEKDKKPIPVITVVPKEHFHLLNPPHSERAAIEQPLIDAEKESFSPIIDVIPPEQPVVVEVEKKA